MTIQYFELSKLRFSEKNVRTINPSKAEDKSLLASLRAYGVLQNLVGEKISDDHIDITAGGRRLAGLNYLLEQGEITAEYQVPVKPIEAELSTGASLTENVIRVPMNAVDEFKAIKTMFDEGMTETEIASKFNMKVKGVKQRMRIANVIEPVQKAYVAGKIDIEILMEFAGTESHKKQREVWNAVKGEFIRGGLVKRLIQENTVLKTSGLAKYVGFKNYTARGGTVETDLFSDEVFLLDTDILREAAGEKLDKIVEQQNGWAWVQSTMDERTARQEHHFIDKTKRDNIPKKAVTELDKLRKANEYWEYEHDGEWDDGAQKKADAAEKALIEAEDAFDAQYLYHSDEVKASSGCIVSFDADSGEVVLLEGAQTSDDFKASQTAKKKQKMESGETGKGAEEPVGLSQALISDLGIYRRQVLSVELSRKAQIADDLLTYSLAVTVLGTYSTDSLTALSTGYTDYKTSKDDLHETKAGVELAKLLSQLKTDWMDDEKDPFAAFQALSVSKKRNLKSFCTAHIISVGIAGDQDTFRGVESVIEPRYAKYWRPSADSYFRRVSLKVLQQHGQEFYGDDWLDANSKASKKELVERFDNLFNGPVKGLTESEKSIRESWIPKEFQVSLSS